MPVLRWYRQRNPRVFKAKIISLAHSLYLRSREFRKSVFTFLTHLVTTQARSLVVNPGKEGRWRFGTNEYSYVYEREKKSERQSLLRILSVLSDINNLCDPIRKVRWEETVGHPPRWIYGGGLYSSCSSPLTPTSIMHACCVDTWGWSMKCLVRRDGRSRSCKWCRSPYELVSLFLIKANQAKPWQKYIGNLLNQTPTLPFWT